MGDKGEAPPADQKGPAEIYYNLPPQGVRDYPPMTVPKLGQPLPQSFNQGPAQRFVPPPPGNLQPQTAPPSNLSAAPLQPLDRPMPPFAAVPKLGQPLPQSFNQGPAQRFIPPPPGNLQPQTAPPSNPISGASQPVAGFPQSDPPKLGMFPPLPSSKFFVPLPMEAGGPSSKVSPPFPPPNNPASSVFERPQVVSQSSSNSAASPEQFVPLQKPGSLQAQPEPFPLKFGPSVLPPFPAAPKPGTMPPQSIAAPPAKLGAVPEQVPQKQAAEGTPVTYAFQVPVNRPQPVSSAASPYFAPVPFKPAASAQPRYQPVSLMPEPEKNEEAKEVPEAQEQVGTGVVSYLSSLVERGKDIIKSHALPLPEDDLNKSVKWRLENCTWLTGDWEHWTCPRCTYENTCEYYQCEMCSGENVALRIILNAANRPAKIHEHTGIRSRLGI